MKNINENVIDDMKKIVKNKSAMKINGVMVDLYTASAVTKIYDIVNPANKKKMEKMSPQGLATAAFKILGKKESVDEEKATPEEKAELALKHAKETESLKDKQGREKETLMQKEDASGMNSKQKMKFDQLMKKLDGGKEHMKFKRMAKTPVQGDDMFHGYVKDLAMKESVKISFHSKGAKTKWMKKQAVASKEILNQTPTSVELPSRWKDLSKKKDHDEIFSVNEAVELEEKAITLGGTNGTGGEIFMGDKGIQKMIALSKKNPNIEYTVKSDNSGDFKAHWLKNGKFARRTVANINFDMDKNAVRGVPKGKTVKSTIFVLRYSVNEGVQMENDEYDNEGGMALQQLKVAKDAAMELCDIIKKDDNLPEWVQSKLTKAVDYMDSVRDYMSSKDTEEYVDESMARARADARRHMGGRGAQRGMAPLKKDVDNDATDGDRKAASKHIIQQIRKAADLPNGAEVEFKNGKGKVDRRSAQMVLQKYLAMKKPMDKEKFQASIKSLADVKKILGR